MAAEVAMSKISVETHGNPRLAGKSMLKPKYNARATFDLRPLCASGAVVCSLFLLICWAQRACCQAETPSRVQILRRPLS